MGVGQTLLRAGMNGEDNGEHSGEGIDGAEEARQYFGGIDVRGAVECEDSELAPAVAVEEAEFGADAGFLGERKELAQRIAALDNLRTINKYLRQAAKIDRLEELKL